MRPVKHRIFFAIYISPEIVCVVWRMSEHGDAPAKTHLLCGGDPHVFPRAFHILASSVRALRKDYYCAFYVLYL